MDSTTIPEHPQQEARLSNAAVVYFYYDHSNIRKQTFRNLVSSALNQLVALNGECMYDIQALYDRKQKGSKGQPTSKDLLILLSSFISHFTQTSILVDALDECIELDSFFLGLAELRNSTNARVLMTSRQEV